MCDSHNSQLMENTPFLRGQYLCTLPKHTKLCLRRAAIQGKAVTNTPKDCTLEVEELTQATDTASRLPSGPRRSRSTASGIPGGAPVKPVKGLRRPGGDTDTGPPAPLQQPLDPARGRTNGEAPNAASPIGRRRDVKGRSRAQAITPPPPRASTGRGRGCPLLLPPFPVRGRDGTRPCGRARAHGELTDLRRSGTFAPPC